MLLFCLIIMVFTLGLYASDLSSKAQCAKTTTSRLATIHKDLDGSEVPFNSGSMHISTKSSLASLPGTKVGETAYNYQTNDNLHDRIYYDTNTGTVHVQWMYADIAETATG